MEDEQRQQIGYAVGGLAAIFPGLVFGGGAEPWLIYAVSMLGSFYACLGLFAGVGATFTVSRFAAHYSSFPVYAVMAVGAAGASPAFTVGWLVTTVRKGYPQG